MGTFSVECIAPCGRKWSDVFALMHKAPTKTHMCSTALCTAHCTHIRHVEGEDARRFCSQLAVIAGPKFLAVFEALLHIIHCLE